jgi:hypothetical protein
MPGKQKIAFESIGGILSLGKEMGFFALRVNNFYLLKKTD